MMAIFTVLFLLFQWMGVPAHDGAGHRLSPQTIAALADASPGQDPDFLPVPVFKAPRVYPESAKKDSLQGTVWVEAVVDESGRVQDAKIKSGVRSDLNEAAISCVRQWIFKPALQKGRPVNCTIEIPFHFKMRK